MSQTTIRAPFGRLKCCWKQESHTVSIQRVHWNWKTRRQLIKENKSMVFLIIYKYDIISNHFSIHTKNWKEIDILKHIASGAVNFDLLSPKYIQNLQYDTSALTHKLKTQESYFTCYTFCSEELFCF